MWNLTWNTELFMRISTSKIRRRSYSLLLSLRAYIRIAFHVIPHSFSLNTSILTRAHLLTSLLTPWCRVLLEKLAGLQLVKKFPAFYGTRRFITAFTSFRHPSLSWASPIQSPYPQPTSCRSILILSTHLRLGFPTRTLYAPSPPPYEPHAQPISFFLILSPAQY